MSSLKYLVNALARHEVVGKLDGLSLGNSWGLVYLE
jgi:hypothetical protein